MQRRRSDAIDAARQSSDKGMWSLDESRRRNATSDVSVLHR